MIRVTLRACRPAPLADVRHLGEAIARAYDAGGGRGRPPVVVMDGTEIKGPTDAGLRLDGRDELEAVEGRFLRAMPPALARRLLAEGIRINVPAGAIVYRDDEPPRVLIILEGLLRVFLSSVGGRQVTVRYVRPGDVAGLVLVIGGPAPMSIQAMTSSLLVALRPDTLRDLLATDPAFSQACAEELSAQLHNLLDDIAQQAFLSVRQRLVRQLLLLAAVGPGRELVVRATQQELADAIGSVREVVTRNLHQLGEEGLVDVARDEVTLLDPSALAAAAHARAGTGPWT